MIDESPKTEVVTMGGETKTDTVACETKTVEPPKVPDLGPRTGAGLKEVFAWLVKTIATSGKGEDLEQTKVPYDDECIALPTGKQVTFSYNGKQYSTRPAGWGSMLTPGAVTVPSEAVIRITCAGTVYEIGADLRIRVVTVGGPHEQMTPNQALVIIPGAGEWKPAKILAPLYIEAPKEEEEFADLFATGGEETDDDGFAAIMAETDLSKAEVKDLMALEKPGVFDFGMPVTSFIPAAPPAIMLPAWAPPTAKPAWGAAAPAWGASAWAPPAAAQTPARNYGKLHIVPLPGGLDRSKLSASAARTVPPPGNSVVVGVGSPTSFLGTNAKPGPCATVLPELESLGISMRRPGGVLPPQVMIVVASSAGTKEAQATRAKLHEAVTSAANSLGLVGANAIKFIETEMARREVAISRTDLMALAADPMGFIVAKLVERGLMTDK